MNTVRLALAVFGAALAATAAPAAAPNWLTVVDTVGGGHRIGNPAAKIKLTEFVSYTCPHCGEFTRESNALEVYVATGKVQTDVRHVIRDVVDLTVTMAANCGPAAKFPRNHAALMFSQPTWLDKAARATTAQQARWTTGPTAARRRAIASDIGLYAIMAPRGYDRPALDRCLADEALAKRLAAQTQADEKRWDITGTPSFAIDGKLLVGTFSWKVLQPQLDARI